MLLLTLHESPAQLTVDLFRSQLERGAGVEVDEGARDPSRRVQDAARSQALVQEWRKALALLAEQRPQRQRVQLPDSLETRATDED